MSWKSLRDPLYPWARTLDRILQAIVRSSLQGPTMVIASDYGGTHPHSRYRVDVHLYVDLRASDERDVSRRETRRCYLADGCRMSYKSLSDRQRGKALVPFLRAAELIHGICLVTIFNKKLKYLCLAAGDHEKMRKAANLQAHWADNELEQAVRATHIVACLVGGLSSPGQNVFWISDEDDLFANSKRKHDMARLLSSFSSHYAPYTLGELGIGTTALDEGDRFEEDLTAVADLVAGGIAETTNRLAEKCGGRIPASLAIEYTGEFLPKADLIARWFWAGAGELRRVAVLFEEQGGGQYSVSRHSMEST